MLQQLYAFFMSLAKWPDGVVVKAGNRLETQAAGAGVTSALCDETGRLLLDEAGRILTDTES